VPDLIGLLVSDAKLAWTDAGFTGDFNPNNAVDLKTVLTQTTNPVTSPPISGCLTITAEVTITYGDPPADPCDVPNMIGDPYADAQQEWALEGFTTTLTKSGPNSGTVYQQTPTHPGVVSCDVVGDVRLRN
jgi:beta-lactam-binding protein with PASTA domain